MREVGWAWPGRLPVDELREVRSWCPSLERSGPWRSPDRVRSSGWPNGRRPTVSTESRSPILRDRLRPLCRARLAARVTDRLKLGTGVTNPYTRHPAVTASAIPRCRPSPVGGRPWASVEELLARRPRAGPRSPPCVRAVPPTRPGLPAGGTRGTRRCGQWRRRHAPRGNPEPGSPPGDQPTGVAARSLTKSARRRGRHRAAGHRFGGAPRRGRLLHRRRRRGASGVGRLYRPAGPRYAIVGAPASCVARLTGLFALGLDRIVLLHASPGADDAEVERTGATDSIADHGWRTGLLGVSRLPDLGRPGARLGFSGPRVVELVTGAPFPGEGSRMPGRSYPSCSASSSLPWRSPTTGTARSPSWSRKSLPTIPASPRPATQLSSTRPRSWVAHWSFTASTHLMPGWPTW